MGIFTSLFLLFIRFLPMIAMSEVKTATPEADPHYGEAPGPESVSPGGKERTREMWMPLAWRGGIANTDRSGGVPATR